MSDILAPEALSRIDAFYDTTLKPKLEAIDDQRRQIQWLIIKSLMIVLPPIGILIVGDLLDGILPFLSGAGRIVIAWVWLVAGVVFACAKYVLPGITAYANYRSRFKKEIVGVEVKAAATVRPESLRGLAWLRELAGDRFKAGVLMHVGEQAAAHGDRLWSAPISSLWAP